MSKIKSCGQEMPESELKHKVTPKTVCLTKKRVKRGKETHTHRILIYSQAEYVQNFVADTVTKNWGNGQGLSICLKVSRWMKNSDGINRN